LTFPGRGRKIEAVSKGGLMAEEHEQRTEEEVTDEQVEAVEDLDVPSGQQDDVGGGFKQAWPKKYEEG
jgi:hypothetical protein